MTSRFGRWSLAVAGVAAAIASAFVLVHLRSAPGSPSAAVAATAPALAVQDASRPPWYGLSLLRDTVSFTPSHAKAPAPAPKITASAGILVDVDTGRILWQLNPHERLAPASTIKLLTALVTLHNFDPNKLITVTPQATSLQWDESRMFLHPGDRLTVRELLSGLLVASANDAANTLADDTVGEERFVGAMNAQAQALGLKDTHATSPVGLDDPGTYSSAFDLATLATEDVRTFPLFREIVSQRGIDLPASPLHQELYLSNINLLLGMYPAAVGIKTGYTGNAGPCEVGMAVRNGHRLISVLLNADLPYGTTKKLLDWGFTVEGLPSQIPPSPSPSPSPSPHH